MKMIFENNTVEFIKSNNETSINYREIYFEDELDFVLVAISYDHWK